MGTLRLSPASAGGRHVYTVRTYVPNRQGRCVLRLTNPDITEASVVHVSVCRAYWAWNRLMRLYPGEADVCVGEIACGNGHVDFVVTVPPPYSANLLTDISIFDPPPGALVIGT
jgi:hypothetical protein